MLTGLEGSATGRVRKLSENQLDDDQTGDETSRQSTVEAEKKTPETQKRRRKYLKTISGVPDAFSEFSQSEAGEFAETSLLSRLNVIRTKLTWHLVFTY